MKILRQLTYYKNCSLFRNKLKLVNHINLQYASYSTDLKIGDINLNKYINKLEKEYATVSKEMGNKRLHELQPIINVLKERKNVIENLNNLNDLLKDNDDILRKLAEEEKVDYESKLNLINEELQEVLLPVDDEDRFSEMVLEVNAGVGGQEAMLFAGEMIEMYSNYAIYKGWNVQLADYGTTDAGGIRHGSLIISGNEVFKYFKHEAGVHRVQRIPATEKSGRIHTSTISVNALPQPDDIQVHIENKDLKIETKRASGAGGQHVNTTDSAVRILHLPTGLAIECQTNRSQIKNREIALQRLKAKLYEQQMESQMAKLEATKKSQVRSNFRNEKIRTYNFGQDRITDHRLSSYNVHNLKNFMLGGEPLDDLINKIDNNLRLERLKQLVEDL